MNLSCPECGDVLSAQALRCACGWKKQGAGRQKSRDPDHGRCAYTDMGGRCRAAGTLSPHAYMQNPENDVWYCSKHFWQRQKAGVTSQRTQAVGLKAVQDLHALLMVGKKNV